MTTDAPPEAIRHAYNLMHMNADEDEDIIDFLTRVLVDAGFKFGPLNIKYIEF